MDGLHSQRLRTQIRNDTLQLHYNCKPGDHVRRALVALLHESHLPPHEGKGGCVRACVRACVHAYSYRYAQHHTALQHKIQFSRQKFIFLNFLSKSKEINIYFAKGKSIIYCVALSGNVALTNIDLSQAQCLLTLHRGPR